MAAKPPRRKSILVPEAVEFDAEGKKPVVRVGTSLCEKCLLAHRERNTEYVCSVCDYTACIEHFDTHSCKLEFTLRWMACIRSTSMQQAAQETRLRAENRSSVFGVDCTVDDSLVTDEMWEQYRADTDRILEFKLGGNKWNQK